MISYSSAVDVQSARFEIFKDQDIKTGHFDVTLEIKGKKLYAHKFILTSVSEIMAAMVSDRWTTKDEPIKIESYSYEDFYEFIRFIYTGNCEISGENIYQLVDMAEFFAVPLLKEYCVYYIRYYMQMKVENIDEMYDIAYTYSLPKLLPSIKDFVDPCLSLIYKSTKFVDYKKSFIEYLSTFPRFPDYKATSWYNSESNFFKCVYDWAEHQIMKEKLFNDNLQEAIKTELYAIIPDPKFAEMNFEFLKNFVVEKGFFLSRTEFLQLYMNLYDRFSYKIKAVYELAEKQAKKKQMIAVQNGDEVFNVANTIKDDLSKIIPHVKFYEMDKEFLMDFVVANGIITEEQANHVFDTRVEVKVAGKRIAIISGVFKDDLCIRKAVQNKFSQVKCTNTNIQRFYKFKFLIPISPSYIKKMDSIEWYLCLDHNGILAIKHHSVIETNDYLIAEMKSKTEFKLVSNEMIHLTAGYRNV